jgi:glycosyltransferase involved in cell wall biosynthesis
MSIINPQDFSPNIIFYKYNIKSILNLFLDKLTKEYNIHKVFTIFGPSYWKPKVPHICGYAKPQYIYKNSPFFENLSMINRLKLNLKKMIQLYYFNQSNVLITENEDVSKKLNLLISNRKIFTVTNYYNQLFDHKEQWDKSIKLPQFEGLTLLTISANYPHKNLNIIPHVIEILNNTKPDLKFRFVVTVNESDFTNSNPDVKKKIVFLGKININQCPNLYEQSDFMFLPTLLECFSASYPEAMYMKRPILTSDLDFAKGLCGKAALYFNPLSPQDIAEKIILLSQNKNLQQTLIGDGLKQLESFDNYQRRAKKYLNIINLTN